MVENGRKFSRKRFPENFPGNGRKFSRKWKFLFGVLREMPGFKDKNIEVFANFYAV